MAGFDLNILVAPSFEKEVKSFFRFLQLAARKRRVRVAYRTKKPEEIYVTIDGPSGAIDGFFQELLLNTALYYYSCTLSPRRKIVDKVIIPIISEIFNSRFERPNTRFLRQHILGKTEKLFIPGEFYHQTAHKYEMLFRQWDLKMLSNYEFIINLDDLLTAYMLKELGHVEGKKSPNFSILVENSKKSYIIRDSEAETFFIEVHRLRTLGLHRLMRSPDAESVRRCAMSIYWYFGNCDELESKQPHYTKLNGKRYKRIKYGEEVWVDEKGDPLLNEDGEILWDKETARERPCHDCFVLEGQVHLFPDCDMEQCPRCKGQALGCDCIYEE